MNKNRYKQAETKGRRAENLAVWLLRFKGYKILEVRCKTPYGEIDLIAVRGKILAIIEVKRRPSLGQAIEALHSANLSRIEEAAYYYQAKHKNLAGLTIRFDAVYVADGLRMKHVKDAWRGY